MAPKFLAGNEIVVSQDIMNDTGFQVGDEIEIETPDGSSISLPLWDWSAMRLLQDMTQIFRSMSLLPRTQCDL